MECFPSQYRRRESETWKVFMWSDPQQKLQKTYHIMCLTSWRWLKKWDCWWLRNPAFTSWGNGSWNPIIYKGFSTSKTVVGFGISGCHQRYGISSGPRLPPQDLVAFLLHGHPLAGPAISGVGFWWDFLSLANFWANNVTRVIVKGKSITSDTKHSPHHRILDGGNWQLQIFSMFTRSLGGFMIQFDDCA